MYGFWLPNYVFENVVNFGRLSLVETSCSGITNLIKINVSFNAKTNVLKWEKLMFK